MTQIAENLVFEDAQGKFRVLAAGYDKVVYYAFPGGKEKAGLNSMPYDDFVQRTENEGCKITDDPYEVLRLMRRPQDSKASQKAAKNHELIQSIVSNPDYLFDKTLRARLIQDKAQGNVTIERKIYRLLNTWWERGQFFNALLPGAVLRKWKGNVYKNKPGRKRADHTQGIIVTDEIKDIFARACRKIVLTPEGNSIRQGFIGALREYTDKHPDCTKDNCPTFSQFKYYYYQNFPPAERTRLRARSCILDKDILPGHGNIYDHVRGPGHIFEIDSTVADVYVRPEKENDAPYRPVLYVVTDVYTGYIIAAVASAANARYQTAADVLFLASSDKRAWVEEHGVEYLPSDWPIRGLPHQIKADNGELAHYQIEFLTRAVGITMCNSPAGRPDLKAKVERAIGSLQQDVHEFLAKAFPDDITLRKAGAKDNRVHAKLTLKEYQRLIIIATIKINSRPNYNSPRGLDADAPSTPYAIYQFAKRHHRLFLQRSYDPVRYRIALLKHYKAVFTDEGIKAKDLPFLYFCQKAAECGYLDHYTKLKKPQEMLMVINPDNINDAFLLPDLAGKPELYWPCTLIANHGMLEGLALEHAEQILSGRKQANAAANREADFRAAKLSKVQEQTAKEAQKRSSLTAAQVKKGNAVSAKKREQAEQAAANPRFGPDVKNKPQQIKPQTLQESADNKYSFPDDIASLPD